MSLKCVDVMKFCSKFASWHSLTLQKKRSSGSHKVHFTENRTVGVIIHVTTWGRTSPRLSPGAENPSYATEKKNTPV